MSKKNKLEEDYKKFTHNIEEEAKQEIAKIHEETDALKEEAGKVGQAVESSLNTSEVKSAQKKVNS